MDTKTTTNKQTLKKVPLAATPAAKSAAPEMPVADNAPTIGELEAKIAMLEKLLNAQMQLNAMNGAAAASAQNAAQTPQMSDVTIVYCSDSPGYAQISNMEMHFTRYGEQFVLNRYQFDELVGKYRKWFDRGILAVSGANAQLAEAKGVLTDDQIGLTVEEMESIGDMSAAELEALWNRSARRENKNNIVSLVKRKFIEGDEKFRNREKIDLLNRLTGGGFMREQDELSGRYKIDLKQF